MKAKRLTLKEITDLYIILRDYLSISNAYVMVKNLPKDKFNQVFEIIFKKKCDIEDEDVATLVLKNAIDNVGLYKFSALVRGKNGN